MHVCHSFPLRFVCAIYVYVFLCAFVCVPLCDAGNRVDLWSEHMCKCVYMHLFQLLNTISFLEVCEYVSVRSCVPCSAGGNPFFLPMYLLLATSDEASSPWGEVLWF